MLALNFGICSWGDCHLAGVLRAVIGFDGLTGHDTGYDVFNFSTFPERSLEVYSIRWKREIFSKLFFFYFEAVVGGHVCGAAHIQIQKCCEARIQTISTCSGRRMWIRKCLIICG